MVERMLLYPRHIGALRAVRASIHTVIAGLDAERLTSSEPVPFEEAVNAEFEPTRKGEIWGGLYDCCLFRFRGEVPASAKGKHVVLIIDTEGEGLARDMTAGGAPMQGLTHIMSAIDAVQSVPGKRVVEFLDCAEGGERVDVMVDAGFNDIARKHKKVRLGKAVIAVRDDLAVRYYYDYLVLFQLLLTLGKNKNLTSADAREIDSLLRRSYAAWGRDRQVAAAMLEERLNTPNGAAVNEYAAVGHAHLDLAWLWPLRETHRKAARTFATALKNIERYPRYIFGASQAQQFEWMENQQPEIFRGLQKAAHDGRIEIQGGMWTECDCNLPSGESLIRQFTMGEEYFDEKFGVRTDLTWLPDVFGSPASLPQIMKKCGKEYFMTIKLSWNEHNRFPYRTFRWKGIDGSEVVAHMPPQGDYNSSGCPIAVVKSDLKNDQSKDFKEALIAYGVGDGGGGPGEGHLECVMREADIKGLSKVVPSSARAFYERLGRERDRMPVYEGELYLEKHQGTYTSQARNKLNNRLLERALHKCEWLAAAALIRGIDHDREMLRRVWKEVLLYQFHDIIPGSAIGAVYKVTGERYRKMLLETERESERLYAAISRADGGESSETVVNASPFDFEGRIRTASGWRKASVPAYSAAASVPDDAPHGELTAGGGVISNGILRAEIAKDGSITSLRLLGSGREFAAKYLNRLVVYSDPRMHYDAWDINIRYPHMKKRILRAKSVEFKVEGSEAVAEARYECDGCVIVQRMSLVAGEDILRVQTSADWRMRHKMLRADFRPAVWSDEVECDIQFGTIRRSTKNLTKIEKAQFEICAHKYVSVCDGEAGFALLNDCKYGHRVKDGLISLDLLRSPKYPDPGCDMGRHTFSYALRPFLGSAEKAGVVREAYLFNAPPVAAEGGELPPLVTVKGEGIVVETVKPSRDGSGVVVRCYERFGKESEGELTPAFAASAVLETDLREEGGVPAPSKVKFKPFEIKTFLFKL